MDPASDELNILLPAAAAVFGAFLFSLILLAAGYALQYRVVEFNVSVSAISWMKKLGFSLLVFSLLITLGSVLLDFHSRWDR